MPNQRASGSADSAPFPGDDETPAQAEAAQVYARAVGERLRAVRGQRKLSMRQVEAQSGGRHTRSAVGSYERGDRVASVRRLAELADFYCVPLASLLPGAEPVAAPTTPTAAATGKVVLDLQRLWTARDGQSRAAVRYAANIQELRHSQSDNLMSLRLTDLRYLALIYGSTLEALLEQWRASGVIVADEAQDHGTT
jgi:transcriptional regulator with XRE-family HTH domain